MQEYVALGAATVEADSPDEVVERVRYEEQRWTVRHICTASEWLQLEGTGRRPWIGRSAFLSLPFAFWTMTTGRVGPLEFWHPLEWLVSLTPFV